MLNNLYDNIINGRGRLNQENSMGMGVHTLGTRLQKGISRATERERLILSERFCLYHPFPSVLQKYKVTAFRLDSHFLFFTCPPIGELPKNNGCCAPCPSPSH